MEPIQNSEDECEMGFELRQACCKPFDGRRYRKDFRRCFTELSKIVTLSEAYRKHEVHSHSNSKLSQILVSLDSILIPNPSNYKILFSNISGLEISKKISKNIFFQMKSFEFNATTGRVSFKPLFSLEQLELPASEYIVITLATKAILLLNEVAQLELWAARFYTGIGYAGFAQAIVQALCDKFKNFKDCFMFLHHIISYVALTCASVIKILEHSSCNCCKQVDQVIKSCENIQDAMSDIGLCLDMKLLEGTPTFEMYDMIICLLLFMRNDYNSMNNLTMRRLNVFDLSSKILQNACFVGIFNVGASAPAIELAQPCDPDSDREACQSKSACDLYLSSLTNYVMASNCYFLAVFGTNDQEEVKARATIVSYAHEYETLATDSILQIEPARYQENEHYKKLYSSIKISLVMRFIRAVIVGLHRTDPEVRFEVYKSMREARNDIETDEMLLAESRFKLAAALALVTLYFSNTGYNLMSYNNGEHCDELRQGLVEAREVLRELLPKQVSVDFCCFAISDIVQSWFYTDAHAAYGCFDLDPILITLKCMAIIGKVLKPHGRSLVETLRGPVNDVSLANGVEIYDSKEVLTKNKHRSVYSVKKTPEGTLQCEFYVNLENKKRNVLPDDKDASNRGKNCTFERESEKAVFLEGESKKATSLGGEEVPINVFILPKVPTNVFTLPKVSTNVCRVPNKQSSAKYSNRCNTVKMNRTVEYLPSRSTLQTVACKHLYDLDYSLYASRFLDRIQFSRGSFSFAALKYLLCHKINIALLNKDLVGEANEGAESGCSRDPGQQSLYERLTEALSIMSRTADTQDLILEMSIEAADAMGITTEFDNDEENEKKGRKLNCNIISHKISLACFRSLMEHVHDQ